MKATILKRIQDRSAQVSVVGMGYVGLPLAVEFARGSFRVVGVDVSAEKVDLLNAGQSYIPDIPTKVVGDLVAEGLLSATTDYRALKDADAISVCVPTPLRKTKDPDMSYIVSAADEIAHYCHEGLLIVLESTTYPGTTDEIILPRLVSNGFEVGKDVFLAFSPERIDPGNKEFGVRETPKIIGGVTPACLEVASALYATAVDTIVPVSSTRAAEMAKLLENTFRAVNIGLVNEMAVMCDKLGLDVWEIVEAAATKPFGFMPFYPGPGLGGHCIPVDPQYLSWKLKTLNYNARFIELASDINGSMPYYVVDKVADGLNRRRKPLNGSRVLVLGVAYKRDVDDIRESPALDVIHLLDEKGAEVLYNDPYVPTLRHEGVPDLSSSELSDKLLAGVDCVVVVTDHSDYDWAWVAEHAALIVDTRNATSGLKAPQAEIIRL